MLLTVSAPRNAVPVIRLGGNTATTVYWGPSKTDRPSGVDNSIWPIDLQTLQRVSTITGVKLILTLGMPTSSPIYAKEMLTAWKTYIQPSSILAIQIGNNPDHLADRSFRPATYSPSDFFSEYDAYAKVVQEVFPGIDMMGPSYADGWRATAQTDFIQQKLGLTKYHAFNNYEIKGCGTNIWVDQLLDCKSFHIK